MCIYLPAFFVKVLVGSHALPAASKTPFPSHFSVEIQNLVRNVIQFQIQRYETVNFLLESGENIKCCNFHKSEVSDVSSPKPPWGQQLSNTQPHTKIFLTVTAKLPVLNFDDVAVTIRPYPSRGLGKRNTEICTKLSIQASLDLASLCVNIAMECGKGH